jgi:hypothetical protein
MSKKLLMLALAASATALVLPSTAAAITPLHSVGSIPATGSITGGTIRVSSTAGITVTCGNVTGTMTLTTSTAGTLRLTFSQECKENVFGSKCTSTGEPTGSITTEPLTFDLATVQRASAGETKIPGVLLTTSAFEGGTFFKATCGGGLVSVSITGNGVLGRVEFPSCGSTAPTLSFTFESLAHGVQKYTTLEGTTTEYTPLSGSDMAALEMTLSATFLSSRSLECT